MSAGIRELNAGWRVRAAEENAREIAEGLRALSIATEAWANEIPTLGAMGNVDAAIDGLKRMLRELRNAATLPKGAA
jgi:hypothetical protein